MSVIKAHLRMNFSQVVVAHATTLRHNTQEAKARGTLLVPGNSSLHELIPWQTPKIQRNLVSKQKEASKQTIKKNCSRKEEFSALRFSIDIVRYEAGDILLLIELGCL